MGLGVRVGVGVRFGAGVRSTLTAQPMRPALRLSKVGGVASGTDDQTRFCTTAYLKGVPMV